MATGDVKTGAESVTGITLPTGALLEETRRREQPMNVEKNDADGLFNRGKTIRTRTDITMRGTVSGTARAGLEALRNTGYGTPTSPRVRKVTIGEKNEDAWEWTLEAFFEDNTTDDYGL